MPELITRDSLRMKAKEKIAKGNIVFGIDSLCFISAVALGSKFAEINNAAKFDIIKNAKRLNQNLLPDFDELKKYGSAFDVPRSCETLRIKMSVREMVAAGVFNPKASSNTLLPDWSTLWDAMRIDLSLRKAALPTIRQFFYNEIQMPNSDKVFKTNEFYPYFMEFLEYNGSGQAVAQGETKGGQTEDIEQIIYAAGFTFDLLAELFDKSFDFQKVNDAVTLAYNAKRDDLSMSPILAYAYSGVQQTDANTTSDAGRQELLYLTLEDGIDDLSDRNDPITDREIDPMGSIILAHPWDARHIARVVRGLPSVNERIYPGIAEISQVVAYDSEVMVGRSKTVTYTGVTKGTVYLVKPNRYMNIGIKRNLTLEVDMNPNVKTLSREERAWYFVEGQQYADGIANFIQEITLPTW